MGDQERAVRYRVEVGLQNVSPAVWRTLEVPGDLALYRLHQVLQVAMGWEDAHLYLFHVGQQVFGDPRVEWSECQSQMAPP